QSARRELLRDRDAADGEPRSRRDDRSVWNARRLAARILPPLSAPAGGLERTPRGRFVLGLEPRTGLDGLREHVPHRRAATRRRRDQWLLARAIARVLRTSHVHRVAAIAWRWGVHRRSRAA